MKKRTLLFSSTLLLLVGVFVFSACKEETEKKTYPSCKILYDKNGKPLKERLCFAPGEVITNTSDTTIISTSDEEALFAYLQSKGLSPIDTCPCNKKLILWGTPGFDPALIDPIGIVTAAQSQGGPSGGIGLSLNINMSIPTQDPFVVGVKDIFVRNLAGLNTSNVVVIDTGVDTTGAYLMGHIKSWASSPCGTIFTDTNLGLDITDFSSPHPDYIGHGTHVTGVLVDALNRNPEVNVKVRSVQVSSGNSDNISLFNYMCGMYYALEKSDNIDLINNSLGFYNTEMPQTMRHLLKLLNESNILLVAGAGNDAMEQSEHSALLFWPAAFSHAADTNGNDVAINVAAWDTRNTMWERSNWGNYVDVAAPGVGILSSFPMQDNDDKKTVAYGTGTSFAAPLVGLIAAKLKSQNPALTARQIKDCIIESAGFRNMGVRPGVVKVIDKETVLLDCLND